MLGSSGAWPANGGPGPRAARTLPSEDVRVVPVALRVQPLQCRVQSIRVGVRARECGVFGALGRWRRAGAGKVCGQELRLLLCSSHESSGPKILALKLPRERLHVCMAVRAPRVPVPAERESGDGWSCGRG
jgi:hypothetical protein